MKKKLAIFIHSLGKGGAEKVASTIANNLINSFEVYVVLLQNEIVYPLNEEVKIVLMKQNPYAYKKFCEVNKINYSLSMLTRPNLISIISKILGNKTKIIVSEHTNTLLWYSKPLQKIISFLYPIADKVLCVSKKIEYNLNHNLNITNTSVIYNPFNIQEIVENNELYHQNIDFISIGTLYDVKNHELLIRAFAKISDKSKNLYILGDGPLRKFLEQLIIDLKLSNRVFLVGFQSNPYKFLKKAKVFVLTSNNEGLPNVIIEALACKCAIISTDCISGPRELLAPDTDFNLQLQDTIELTKYGILVPIKNENLLINAMEQIDAKESSKLSLKRANDFQSNKIIQQYKELLCAQ